MRPIFEKDYFIGIKEFNEYHKYFSSNRDMKIVENQVKKMSDQVEKLESSILQENMELKLEYIELKLDLEVKLAELVIKQKKDMKKVKEKLEKIDLILSGDKVSKILELQSEIKKIKKSNKYKAKRQL